MRRSGLASLIIFYYDFREDQKKGLRGLLSSVLIQLGHQSDAYCNILSILRSEYDNGSKDPSDDALIRCLKRLLELPRQSPLFLIVDALDECLNTPALSSPREKVLMLLKDLIDSKLPNLRVCVTSRPEVDIKASLEPLAFCSISLHEEHGQEEDIRNYIKSIVNENTKMQLWSLEHKQLVIERLTERANGM
jgi:NACHT domain